MAEYCVCVNVILLLAFSFNSFSQEQVPAPIYKDGDLWVFRVTQSNRVGTASARLEGDFSTTTVKKPRASLNFARAEAIKKETIVKQRKSI